MAIVQENLDFLIIGSGKSGTSSLADLINQHPDILITTPKEPWFFDTSDYKNEMGWYWDQYLSEYAGEKFIGEASSQTLFVPFAAQRLKNTVPDAKFIVILRNPVERAYSDWWMKYGGKWDRDSFDVAIEKNIDQLEEGVDFSNPDVWQEHIDAHKNRQLIYKTYVDYGFYAKQLERYFSLFPKENILIVLFDDLVRNPGLVAKSVWSFIGLKYIDDIRLDSSPKNIAERRLYSSFLVMRNKFKQFDSIARFLPSEFKIKTHKVLKSIGQKKKAKPSKKMVNTLSTIYKEDIEKLEILIQRDLSAWTQID